MSIEKFNDSVNASFSNLERRLNGHATGPLHALRKAALERFNSTGVPTVRDEEWKYTQVYKLVSESDSVSVSELVSESVSESVSELVFEQEVDLKSALDKTGAHTIVLTNSQTYSATYSSDLREALHEILELNDDLVASNVEVRAAITTAAPLDSHPFVALNTALNRSGVVIIAKKQVANPKPLHIMIINDARTGDVLHTPRVLVIAEEGASVEVIETHHTIGEHTALDVTVTELVAKAGSTITYTKLNADAGNGRHVGYTGGKIYRDAVINSHTFCLDGTFTRNDLNLQLMEPNASTYLNGVSVLNEQQFADNHTVVDHLVPHCHSEELYKGVYDGRSVGVFNGKIYVRPQAQKTTAYQSNHSLLLSDRASVNAKPQLEIFADDVKCSHGATMGQLDEEAVFYLQARGIGADEARALMTYAFAAEVIERLPHEELRAYLEQRVATKLGAHP